MRGQRDSSAVPPLRPWLCVRKTRFAPTATRLSVPGDPPAGQTCGGCQPRLTSFSNRCFRDTRNDTTVSATAMNKMQPTIFTIQSISGGSGVGVTPGTLEVIAALNQALQRLKPMAAMTRPIRSASTSTTRLENGRPGWARAPNVCLWCSCAWSGSRDATRLRVATTLWCQGRGRLRC
jgi:hypothetical protein